MEPIPEAPTSTLRPVDSPRSLAGQAAEEAGFESGFLEEFERMLFSESPDSSSIADPIPASTVNDPVSDGGSKEGQLLEKNPSGIEEEQAGLREEREGDELQMVREAVLRSSAERSQATLRVVPNPLPAGAPSRLLPSESGRAGDAAQVDAAVVEHVNSISKPLRAEGELSEASLQPGRELLRPIQPESAVKTSAGAPGGDREGLLTRTSSGSVTEQRFENEAPSSLRVVEASVFRNAGRLAQEELNLDSKRMPAGLKVPLESFSASSPEKDESSSRQLQPRLVEVDFQQRPIEQRVEEPSNLFQKNFGELLKPVEIQAKLSAETETHANLHREPSPFLAMKGEAIPALRTEVSLEGSAAPEAVLSTKQLDGLFNEVVQRAKLLRAGETISFDLQLKPEVLGRLRIETVMHADQSVRALIHVQDPDVRRALEGNLPGLRKSLEESGLQIRTLEVHHSPSQSQTGTDEGSGESEHLGRQPNSDRRPAPSGSHPDPLENPSGDQSGSHSNSGRDGWIHYYA